jgi:hypothetical protein
MMNRKKLIGIAAGTTIAAALLLGIGATMLGKASSRLDSMQSLHSYLIEQQKDLSSFKDKAALFEAKRKNSKGKSVQDVINSELDALGLKEKLESIKSPPGGMTPDEEKAEARLKGLSMNELVNLLYTLDNSRMLILTRKANIRTTFENPDVLNVTLSVSLIKP